MTATNDTPQGFAQREQTLLSPLSSLVARSFATADELIEAVLGSITDHLGLRTSFLTRIAAASDENHILAAHNLVGGCDLAEGVTLPLHETFCSIITNHQPPQPLVIGDVRSDALFGQHAAALASPHIGCFVGVPVVLHDGEVFGTLCAIDPEPHAISTPQLDLLLVLARFVATELDHERERARRDQLEAERDRLYEQAQQALQEREALIAIASHELKNPLAALLGQAELLQRHLQRSEAVNERDQQRLGVIIAQGQRVNRLLSELLDVSRLDAGSMPLLCEPLDLYTLAHRMVDSMSTEYTHHDLELIEPAAPVLVNGDPLRLEQVVRNLLSNAIKYTPAGGRIAVAVEAELEWALLRVEDAGQGIAPEAMPQLFRRFFRAAEAAKGTVPGFGIGLYVVKEIVTRHGGTVEVQSAIGAGSSFVVRLPRLAVR